MGESFASEIAAGLKAAGSVTPPAGGTAITAELAGQYARAVATQIAPLVYRTQGLQLYRDSIYKLCIDRMNGWVKPEQYDEVRKFNYINAIELIQVELPLMQETVKTYYEKVRAGEAKINIEDAVRLIEAQKMEAKPSSAEQTSKPKP